MDCTGPLPEIGIPHLVFIHSGVFTVYLVIETKFENFSPVDNLQFGSLILGGAPITGLL